MNGTDLKDWISTIVEHTNSVGLDVVAFSTDCGKGNWVVLQALYRGSLGNIKIPIAGPDYSHLVNNLLNPLRYAEDGKLLYLVAGPFSYLYNI